MLFSHSHAVTVGVVQPITSSEGQHGSSHASPALEQSLSPGGERKSLGGDILYIGSDSEVDMLHMGTQSGNNAVPEIGGLSTSDLRGHEMVGTEKNTQEGLRNECSEIDAKVDTHAGVVEGVGTRTMVTAQKSEERKLVVGEATGQGGAENIVVLRMHGKDGNDMGTGSASSIHGEEEMHGHQEVVGQLAEGTEGGDKSELVYATGEEEGKNEDNDGYDNPRVQQLLQFLGGAHLGEKEGGQEKVGGGSSGATGTFGQEMLAQRQQQQQQQWAMQQSHLLSMLGSGGISQPHSQLPQLQRETYAAGGGPATGTGTSQSLDYLLLQQMAGLQQQLPQQAASGSAAHMQAGGMFGGETKQTAVVDCPKNMVGRVIGKGGETIKALQQYTGAMIQIDQSTDPTRVTIAGSPQSLQLAVSMVSDIVRGTFKGFAMLRQIAMASTAPGSIGQPQPLYVQGYGFVPPSQALGTGQQSTQQQQMEDLLGLTAGLRTTSPQGPLTPPVTPMRSPPTLGTNMGDASMVNPASLAALLAQRQQQSGMALEQQRSAYAAPATSMSQDAMIAQLLQQLALQQQQQQQPAQGGFGGFMPGSGVPQRHASSQQAQLSSSGELPQMDFASHLGLSSSMFSAPSGGNEGYSQGLPPSEASYLAGLATQQTSQGMLFPRQQEQVTRSEAFTTFPDARAPPMSGSHSKPQSVVSTGSKEDPLSPRDPLQHN